MPVTTQPPDHRPLYVFLTAVCALLVGPALLGLVQHELVWLGLFGAWAPISLTAIVVWELIFVTVAMLITGMTLYP